MDKKDFTTIFFPEEISTSSISDFITELSAALNEYNIIYLYFTSCGGSSVMAELCTDFMNRFSDRIKIITSWQVGSSAVDMIIDSKCEISMLKDTFMSLHLTTRDIDMRELKRQEPGQVFLKENTEKNNKKQIDKYVSFFKLSPKKKAIIENGDDLYLSYDKIVGCINNRG